MDSKGLINGLHLYSAFLTSGHSKCYNIASHLPIHAHIHTPTVVSTIMQGDCQLVRSSQGEVSCSGTPHHSARRSWGSNQQPSSYQSHADPGDIIRGYYKIQPMQILLAVVLYVYIYRDWGLLHRGCGVI